VLLELKKKHSPSPKAKQPKEKGQEKPQPIGASQGSEKEEDQEKPKNNLHSSNKARSNGKTIEITEKTAEKPKEKSGEHHTKYKGISKTGVIYKENKQNKFSKYYATLKGRTLFLTQDGAKRGTSVDLLLTQLIIVTNIKELKQRDLVLFTVDFVSENRRDRIATEDKNDLVDWITRINKVIELTHSNKSGKKTKTQD